jgi:hypothetical protein
MKHVSATTAVNHRDPIVLLEQSGIQLIAEKAPTFSHFRLEPHAPGKVENPTTTVDSFQLGFLVICLCCRMSYFQVQMQTQTQTQTQRRGWRVRAESGDLESD